MAFCTPDCCVCPRGTRVHQSSCPAGAGNAARGAICTTHGGRPSIPLRPTIQLADSLRRCTGAVSVTVTTIGMSVEDRDVLEAVNKLSELLDVPDDKHQAFVEAIDRVVTTIVTRNKAEDSHFDAFRD